MAINPLTDFHKTSAYAESVNNINTINTNTIDTNTNLTTNLDTDSNVKSNTDVNNVDINTVDLTNDNIDFNGNIMLLSATPSIALTFNDNASFTTNATVGDVSYIANTFTVNASGLTGYTVKLSAMNGSGSELHGRDNATATIKPVANNTLPTAFADDTWGYSISTNTAAAPSSLSYSAMPAYGTPKDIYKKTGLTGAANEDSTYLLSFAAKFSTMSPADHYVGNFQLSVVPEQFVPTTYRLNFNANSDSGDVSGMPANDEFTEEVLTASHEFTIPNTIPTRSGYAFMGWAETPGGTAKYAAGGKITVVKSANVTVTLYAVWAQETVYTLNYNANNGTGAPGPERYEEPGNSTATSHDFKISATKPTRTDHTFLGWAESNTATKASYQPNGTYTVPKSSPTKTLWAVWAQDTKYTLKYDLNGGSGTFTDETGTITGDKSDTSYEFTISSTKPTKTGYAFLGWADSKDATAAQYEAGSKITVNRTSANTVKTIYAIWQQDGTTYQLAYNANGGSGVPDAQSQVSAASSYSFTIPSTTPTRSGYTFRGWSPTTTPITTIYQPGATYTVQGASPSQTLYAVWRSNTIFNGITTMQAMNSTICSNAIEGDEAILTDTRDNNKYYVTKLADGNCWMTQNLAYGTVADTSIGTPCELNGTANGATCAEGTSWSNSSTNKYFAIGKHDDGSHTSQGNYYNWQAAIQGTTGGTGIQGVCPSGWQLPTSNSTTANKSFGKLTTSYGIGNNSAGSTTLRGMPLYFKYGGYLGNGTLYNSGSDGRYWSSTPNGTDVAYRLYFDSGYVFPSNLGDRYLGYSVRCVAQ